MELNLEKFKAVYIDDNVNNLMLLEAFCQEIGLDIKCFEYPKEGVDYILNNDIDILFTDYMMPEMNGVEVIEKIRNESNDTIIVMITAAGEDYDLKIQALESGATDFLTKPVDFLEFQVRVKNLLKLKDKALLLQDEVREATKTIIQREQETLAVLGKAAEYKDPETGSHIVRVAHYSKLLSEKLGKDTKFIDTIFYAAPLHDIGKIGISDNILLKPAKLSDEEFEVMKTHSTLGVNMLVNSQNRYLKMGAEIAYGHHEKFNGSGYPRGIAGEEIPLSARIVAVADVFDALTSVRPYKKAWGFDKAIELLYEESGKHFDPSLVELFILNITYVKEIYKKYQE